MEPQTPGECCCVFGLARRQRRRRAKTSTREARKSVSEASSLIGQDQPELADETPKRSRRRPGERFSCSQRSAHTETIELKCYRFSENQLLVNADKRCCLAASSSGGGGGQTRTRLLASIEDGRRHLDVARKPTSLSLIKLEVDPESGELRRRFSIREIEEGQEFEDLNPGLDSRTFASHTQQAEELARKLANRSYVLIERDSGLPAGSASPSPSFSPCEDQPSSGPAKAASLEREFVESLSLDKFPLGRVDRDDFYSKTDDRDCSQDGSQVNQQVPFGETNQQPAVASKKPRKPFKLARKLFGWLGGGGGGVAHPKRGSDSPEAPATGGHGEQSPLARPDSVYLWPERLCDSYGAALHAQLSASQTSRRLRRAAPQVMISYNHLEARDYAIALHDELEWQGVSAYLDVYDIQKGDDWQDSLNFAILDCRLFVALVTPSYGETLWTSRECKLADVLAKRIVPINFGLRWPPPSLAIQFATLQYIDWLHHDDLAAGVLEDAQVAEGAEQCGPPARWPRECVRAIAHQVRRRLESDLAPSEEIPPLRERHLLADLVTAERPQAVGLGPAGGSLSLPRTPASSLGTQTATSSSASSSCPYESLAGDNSPGLEPEELSGGFVLVPHEPSQGDSAEPPPVKRRKRSLGLRTKKVLARLRRRLAAVSSPTAAVAAAGQAEPPG